jgi:hypothetical protein
MGLVASKMKVSLPADKAIDAEVDLGTTEGAFFLQARLNVSTSGVERLVDQAIVDGAHHPCPYSKATRCNIDVVINLVYPDQSRIGPAGVYRTTCLSATFVHTIDRGSSRTKRVFSSAEELVRSAGWRNATPS